MQQPPEGVDQVRHDFGRKVQEARAELEISQRQLAEKLAAHGLRLDPSAITRIEKGTRPVRVEEAVVLAKVLETRVSTLLDEPAIDPLDHLQDLRSDADDYMNRAAGATRLWLSILGDIQGHLREHPELLENLARRPDDHLPSDVEGYLPWVSERVRNLDTEPVLMTEERDAEHLRGILGAWLAKYEFLTDEEFFVRLKAMESETAEAPEEQEGEDGEHPEAPER